MHLSLLAVFLATTTSCVRASPVYNPSLHTFSKRAINVLTPRWGYTVRYPGNHTHISWTEPTTRDLRISLMRGAPGQLIEVGPYDSFVDNDGQYEWLNEDYDDTDLKSGCDYKFRLAIEDDEDTFGDSEYFVVVRDGDGGLTDDTMCPGPRGNEGETVRYADLASRAASNQPNDETADGLGSSTVKSDDSVSRTTLIIAVVVSDIGILILLMGVVLVGRRRSWFVSRDFLATYVGVVQKAQARLEEQNQMAGQGQGFLQPHGVATGEEKPYVSVISDDSPQGGGYATGDSTAYTGRSEADRRDAKIAQLE